MKISKEQGFVEKSLESKGFQRLFYIKIIKTTDKAKEKMIHYTLV